MDTKIITKKIKGENRHWRNYEDKEYIGSHNLEEGEEFLVTIEKFVGEEEIKTADGKKKKPVLYFREDVPKMIVNTTNGKILEMLYGSHPENWRGKQIQLYSAKGIKAFGKLVDAIRIRDFRPKVDIDLEQWTAYLQGAKSKDELGKMWGKMPLSVKGVPEIIAFKDKRKAELELPVIEAGAPDTAQEDTGAVSLSDLPPELR